MPSYITADGLMCVLLIGCIWLCIVSSFSLSALLTLAEFFLCVCSFNIHRKLWRSRGSSIFSMSKAHIISPHEAETSAFRMMDYDQSDEDVCHYNTLLEMEIHTECGAV